MTFRVFKSPSGEHYLRKQIAFRRFSSRELTEFEIEEYYSSGTIPNFSGEDKMTKINTVSKLLSMCLLISRDEFVKQDAAKQTETLTGASGLPIIFVDNFGSVSNKKKLIEKLLAGEDASMELEFNEIKLTKEQIKTLADFGPIIESIGPVPRYPWLNERTQLEANRYLEDYNWSFTDSEIKNPLGYWMTKAQCKKAWDYASRFWATGEKLTQPTCTSGYDRKKVNVTVDTLKFGCQTVSREDAEAVAQYFGFKPNLGD